MSGTPPGFNEESKGTHGNKAQFNQDWQRSVFRPPNRSRGFGGRGARGRGGHGGEFRGPRTAGREEEQRERPQQLARPTHQGERRDPEEFKTHRGGPRGRGRNLQHVPRGPGGRKMRGETVKIRRRFFQNNHWQEKVWNEEDFKVEDIEENSQLRANDSWENLGLDEGLVEAVYNAGYKFPSKIQATGLKAILQDDPENVVAQAPSGSGKTAAFVLGSLCRVDIDVAGPQVLCLAHTIELSHQNQAEYNKFASSVGVSVSQLTRDSNKDELGHVVVTTEGLLMRKIRSKEIDLTNLKVVVFDEADHLLDPEQQREFCGFVKKCIKDGNFPSTTQYLLFSATFSEEVKKAVADMIESYIELTLKTEDLMLDCVHHYFMPCDQQRKVEELKNLVRRMEAGVGVVFINTCDFARRVTEMLTREGLKVALLMGKDMTVGERTLTMEDFRAGKFAALITTNLLARGIDNTLVRWVVNFDLPGYRKQGQFEPDLDLYVHRSGRAGRFGRPGVAISFVTGANDQAIIEEVSKELVCEIKEFNLDEINNYIKAEVETETDEVKE